MKNENAYLKPVTLRNILKFAVPTVAMTVFMSFYTTAISTMLATGSSAVIMKKMGEGKIDEAKYSIIFYS